MIRRMLWKEWRERRLVWLALALAAAAPVAFGSGFSFSGEVEAFSPWIMLPIAVSAKLGIGLYSKDSDQDSGDFMFSRPVDWRAILAAKLAVGAAAVIMTAAIAALAYLIFARPQYRPFIGVEQIGNGIEILGLLLLLGFLAGYASSALAPSRGGSVAVFAAFWVFTASTIALTGHWWVRDTEAAISSAAWFVGGAFAAGVVTRFGLTAGFRYRLRVYALCIGAAFLVLAAVESGYHTWAANSPHRPRLSGLDPDSKLSKETFLSVSPDGRYGVTSVGPSLVRIEGRKLIPVKKLTIPLDLRTRRMGICWAPSGLAYWAQRSELLVLDPASGKIARIAMPANAMWLVPSPTGRFVVYSTGMRSDDQPLYFVDLQAARRLDGMVQSTSSAWWMDEDTVGYTDEAGRRSFVRVSGLRPVL